MRRGLALIPVLAAVVLGACSHEPRFPLVHEDQVPALAELKALSAARERRLTLVPTRVDDGPEVRLAVHEVGDGSHERTLVLIHGIFTDCDTWRFVLGLLAQDHNVLVVDLPGCGASDKPAAAGDPAAETVYTPPMVARRVLQAVETVLRERAPTPGPVAVVGHSYGGMVAIRMFSDESVRGAHTELLGRVDRLVLFSPVDAEISHPDPMFEQLAGVTAFGVHAGLAIGKIQDVLAEATLRSTPETSPALYEEYHKRLGILRDPGTRRGLQALVAHAVPWHRDKDARYHPDWPAMEAVTRGYAKVDVPALIIWGQRDETLPVSMGYKLAAQLPRAELVTVPGAMHSLQLERPRYAVELITQFLGKGETGAAPVADGISPAALAEAP